MVIGVLSVNQSTCVGQKNVIDNLLLLSILLLLLLLSCRREKATSWWRFLCPQNYGKLAVIECFRLEERRSVGRLVGWSMPFRVICTLVCDLKIANTQHLTSFALNQICAKGGLRLGKAATLFVSWAGVSRPNGVGPTPTRLPARKQTKISSYASSIGDHPTLLKGFYH